MLQGCCAAAVGLLWLLLPGSCGPDVGLPLGCCRVDVGLLWGYCVAAVGLVWLLLWLLLWGCCMPAVGLLWLLQSCCGVALGVLLQGWCDAAVGRAALVTAVGLLWA